jgi:hypothetical protein
VQNATLQTIGITTRRISGEKRIGTGSLIFRFARFHTRFEEKIWLNVVSTTTCVPIVFRRRPNEKGFQFVKTNYFQRTECSLHVTIIHKHAILEYDGLDSTDDFPEIITEHFFVISYDIESKYCLICCWAHFIKLWSCCKSGDMTKKCSVIID